MGSPRVVAGPSTGVEFSSIGPPRESLSVDDWAWAPALVSKTTNVARRRMRDQATTMSYPGAGHVPRNIEGGPTRCAAARHLSRRDQEGCSDSAEVLHYLGASIR